MPDSSSDIVANLPETGISFEIEHYGSLGGDAVVQINFGQELYNRKGSFQDELFKFENRPEGVAVGHDETTVFLGIDQEGRLKEESEKVIEYLGQLDDTLAEERGIDTRDKRRENTVEEFYEKLETGENPVFSEKLPYSGIEADIVYQGFHGDNHSFTYNFDEVLHEGYGNGDTIVVNDRTVELLKQAGPETVDMAFESSTEASVDVEAQGMEDAVKTVYQHLAEIDEEYANTHPERKSRQELEQDVENLLERNNMV